MATQEPTAVKLSDDRSSYIYSSVGICLTLAIISTIARLVSRRIQRQKLIATDYLVMFGLAGAITEACLIFESTKVGFGMHVQTLSPEHLRKFLELFFAAEIFYVVTIVSTKISILLLYVSLFPDRTIANVAKVLAAFVFAWAIACIFGIIFSCNPVNGFWDKSFNSTCIDSTKFFIGNAVPNIFTDTAILCLPIRVVWQLHMSKKSKVAVSGIFLLGSFVIVASILRLVLLFNEDLNDLTWGLVNAFTWSNIELDVAVLSASLPTIQPALKKVWSLTTLNTFRGSDRSKDFPGSKDTFVFHNLHRRPAEDFMRLPDSTSHDNSITTLSKSTDVERGEMIPNQIVVKHELTTNVEER